MLMPTTTVANPLTSLDRLVYIAMQELAALTRVDNPDLVECSKDSTKQCHSNGSMMIRGQVTEKSIKRSRRQRIEQFLDDQSILLFSANFAACRGCGSILKLDDRRRYYPDAWVKHSRRCKALGRGFYRFERVPKVCG